MLSAEQRAHSDEIRAQQGLPPKIEDPATLERVAAIFRLVDADALAALRAKRREAGAEGAGAT